MSGLYKRVELAANVAIIVVAIGIGALVLQRFLPTKSAKASGAIPIGTKIVLSDVDWGSNHKTLLIALQKGCHFCAESAPFYKRLSQEAVAKGVKLIAVLPQSSAEARAYLNGLDVPISDVRQAGLDSLSVSGTPTLILVDEKGEVAGSWVGRLPAEKESEVLARL